MKKKICKIIILVVIIVCYFENANSEIKLPALITNNMVLQRQKEINIWGWAEVDEQVTVSIDHQEKSTITGTDGRWEIKLDPMEASGPYEMVISGRNTIKLRNVLVGEVWICSGQSNMQWPVRYSANPGREIACGNHPSIRLFTVKKQGAAEPRTDCIGQWEECTPITVADFSAVAYFFGRELMKELNVPVGLIQSAWGGTPCESWVNLDALRVEPKLQSLLKGWEKVYKEKPREFEEYYDLLASWFVYAFVCMGQKKSYGEIPKPPEQYAKDTWVPSWLYNAMIAPLTPFVIRGVIWYQGESNSGKAYQYRALFPTLIRDWRNKFGQGDFPFLYVQLSNLGKRETKPVNSGWAELQEAQLMTLKEPNTAMAVTIDIGEADDVHYKNKQDVGRRLSLGALKLAYGKNIVYSGPLYDYSDVRDGKMQIHFKHTGSGLISKNSNLLAGFAIAGADSQFVWAKAEIDGKDVVVWNETIPNPVAVRYAWGNNPECNLYNKEGLPASPFRTDDWQRITKDKDY